jgi:xylulokinase
MILAIDLGTSNVKAAVVRRDGELVGTGRASVETKLLPNGGAEQDAEQMWQAVLEASAQALALVKDKHAIKGVACDSQYSSIVPVDAHGRPTANAVLWMDKRGAPARLEKLPGGRGMNPSIFQKLRWLQIHAIPPLDSGADSLAHMRWLKLARPEVYAKTATFLEPMDYITMRLCGRRVANRCSVFMMLLTDNRRADPVYHPRLVKWSGLDADKLPELVPIDEPLGPLLPEVAESLGLSEEALVFPGINDTLAGGIGTYAFSGDHVGIAMGTTSVIVTHVPFKKTDIRNSIVSMPSPIDGQYFVMGEIGIGGRALEYFLENLVFASDAFADHSLEDKFAALHDAVEGTPPGSDGVLFLPWLSGSIAPAEDGRVRGGFLNMSLETTREHLARSVLEGVAFNFRWALDAIGRFAKRRPSHMLFYGGGALSSVWSQIIADVHQLPVHQLRDPEFTPCRGTALLAFHRLGELALEEIQDGVPVEKVFEPRPELANRYDELFRQFVRAFHQNRKIFRALNSASET